MYSGPFWVGKKFLWKYENDPIFDIIEICDCHKYDSVHIRTIKSNWSLMTAPYCSSDSIDAIRRYIEEIQTKKQRLNRAYKLETKEKVNETK